MAEPEASDILEPATDSDFSFLYSPGVARTETVELSR